MAAPDWPRFEPEPGTGSHDEAHDLARCMARVFSLGFGPKVLDHLKAMTLDRCLGPEASTRALRHLEGQRQLVLHILAMVQRGQDG